MNSDKTLYDWKRYWIPHESHEESYFEYSSLYNNNEKSTLANLRDKKCLILLGDAALGKSTVLNQEYKDLQNADMTRQYIAKLKSEHEDNEKFQKKLDKYLDNFDVKKFMKKNPNMTSPDFYMVMFNETENLVK